MKKKMMLSMALAAALVVGTTGPCLAVARYLKCEVKEIQGEMVILECDKADGLEVGSKVRVRRVKEEEAFEGC